MSDSRTKKSLLNSITSLIFFGLNIPVAFINRRFVFQYLGPELLGMEGVVSNILGMVNVAELGIYSAILFSLYKPLVNKDTKKISEVLSIQGILYQYIAYFIISISIIISFLFPFFFSNKSFPLYYVYIIFYSTLINISLSYILNYRMILLVADQKAYKFNTSMLLFGYIKIAIQWISLIYSAEFIKYPLFVGIDLSLTILSTIIIEIIIDKDYPWLKIEKQKGLIFIKRNVIILKKTLQVAFHKLSSVVLNHTDFIFISAFVSLSMVSIYMNYTIIAKSISRAISAAFGSISGGIGTLIAEGDNKKVESLYWEYFSVTVFLTSIAIFGLLSFISDVIMFWIVNNSGTNIRLEELTVLLISVFYFMFMIRIVDHFLAGYGLYKDIWAPIVEGTILLLSSFVLGKIFGLNGIIMGGILSHFFIVILWKQYFLFKEGIKSSVKKMYLSYFKYWLLAWGTILPMYIFFRGLEQDKSNVYSLIKVIVIDSCIFSITLFSIFIVFSKGFRMFLLRMKSFVFKR